MIRDLTDEEKMVMNNSVDCWNNFLKLPKLNRDDVDDFRQKIHEIQRMIMSRPIIETQQKKQLEKYLKVTRNG